MKRLFLYVFLLMLVLAGCKKPDDTKVYTDKGVIIVNEGNFNWGNASISLYDTKEKKVNNSVYGDVNGVQLGDVAQSVAEHDSLLFVVVNNSAKIEVLSANTFIRKWTIPISGSSPRYFLAVNDSIGLVSDLYANKIWKVNYMSAKVIGDISVAGETGNMILFGDKIVVAERTVFNGSYTAQMRVIDKQTLSTLKIISLPSEPNSFIVSENAKLVVLTSFDAASLKIAQLITYDLASYSLESQIDFNATHKPSLLRYDYLHKRLKYVLNKQVFSKDVANATLASVADFSLNIAQIYAFDINPINGELYVGDALDYTQPSQIFRYNSSGELIHSFKAGINATQFYFSR